MGRLGPNQALAVEAIERLIAAGVRTFCLCPGGRNAPLVEVLASGAAVRPGVDVVDFFDERSAAFFALGRARRDGRPAAVVTTSGTACAELLPAMVEAYYSCVPLVALTADRPRSYRGTAAPQTIEQPGIFGVYARESVDLERLGEAWELRLADGPAHVNVCFDEPLLGGWVDDGVASPTNAQVTGGRRMTGGTPVLPRSGTRGALARPLVLLGALGDTADRQDALEFCRRVGAPVLAEAGSHLKPLLGDLLLRGGEAAVRRGFKQRVFDSVVRIGEIPSFRTWRDLELTWRVPVFSASRRPWAGLTEAHHVQVPTGARVSACLPDVQPFPQDARESLLAFDREAAEAADRLLAEFPMSEPAIVRALSLAIPAGSFVYLGNSQPIREWNQFAAVRDDGFTYGENRGANGIDGQLSSFLGMAQPGRENWAIVGDLTALYDLQAPWALRHAEGAVRLVVINNGGGRIFERMFSNPRFQNRHALSFEAFAALWGCEYRSNVEEALPGGTIVELRPDEAQTAAFWQMLAARVKP